MLVQCKEVSKLCHIGDIVGPCPQSHKEDSFPRTLTGQAGQVESPRHLQRKA